MNQRTLAKYFVLAPYKGKASALWVDGDIAYSYATPIAYCDRENNVLWVTSRKYSVTTSKHLNYLCSAAAGQCFDIIEVPFPDTPYHAINAVWLGGQYKDYLQSAGSSRRGDVARQELIKAADRVAAILKKYYDKTPPEVPNEAVIRAEVALLG